jgi:hypothetical protein
MCSLVIFKVHRIVLQCYSEEDEIRSTHAWGNEKYAYTDL